MEDNRLDVTIEKALVPYLTIGETADQEAVRALFGNREVVFKWRYYYGYDDALRTIDLAYSKNIYDDWVLLIAPSERAFADQLLEKHPDIFNAFEKVEEAFLRGLRIKDLKTIVASEQMEGINLEIAQKILKENNIYYTDEQIRTMKVALKEKNSQDAKRMPLVNSLTLVLLLLAVALLVYYNL